MVHGAMHCLYKLLQTVKIYIIESRENFAGETLIEPHYLAQHPPTTILRKHLLRNS